jgi:2-dehydropantoate 2-reductase
VAASSDATHVVRYWSFAAAPTLFERNGRRGARAIELIVAALNRSALPARLSDDVRRRNPATTIAFFPISVGVSRSGGIAALLREETRLALTAQAVRETLVLARKLGPIEAPAAFAGRLIGPRTLRAALLLSRWALPQVTRFVDSHFGTKLSEQHQSLGAEILELGRRHALPLPALSELLDQ